MAVSYRHLGMRWLTLSPSLSQCLGHWQTTYSLTRYLADLLKLLVGRTERHITSFDITALFTSVPGNEVIQMAIERAANDPTWNERTLFTPEEFGNLLKMVVETNHILQVPRQDLWSDRQHVHGLTTLTKLVEPVHGVIRRQSPGKSIPPSEVLWRYVDDTGVVTKNIYEEEFFNHINKQHHNINFTI